MEKPLYVGHHPLRIGSLSHRMQTSQDRNEFGVTGTGTKEAVKRASTFASAENRNKIRTQRRIRSARARTCETGAAEETRMDPQEKREDPPAPYGEELASLTRRYSEQAVYRRVAETLDSIHETMSAPAAPGESRYPTMSQDIDTRNSTWADQVSDKFLYFVSFLDVFSEDVVNYSSNPHWRPYGALGNEENPLIVDDGDPTFSTASTKVALLDTKVLDSLVVSDDSVDRLIEATHTIVEDTDGVLESLVVPDDVDGLLMGMTHE